MATSTWNDSRTIAGANSSSSLTTGLWKILHILGSLKITVAMFALGIVILFVGTLAQDEQTLVDVKNEYFNAWISYIAPDVFLPITIFGKHGASSLVIPFPGGATIGFILLVNLIAAKLTRFQMHAKGGKLIAGLFFCILGSILMGLIVVGAHRGDGLQGEPPFSYDFLWTLCPNECLATDGRQHRLGRDVVPEEAFDTSSLVDPSRHSFVVFGARGNGTIPNSRPRFADHLAVSQEFDRWSCTFDRIDFLVWESGWKCLDSPRCWTLELGQFIFGDQQIEERITLFEGESTRVAYQLDRVELAFLESVDESRTE